MGLVGCTLWAQPVNLTLEQAVALGRLQSTEARAARHAYELQYWNYRSFRANYLPSLTLTSNPTLDRAINKVTMSDGSVQFVEQNLLNTDLTLNLSQNVALTGGTFFINTAAQRIDLLTQHTSSWQTVPVSVGYRQSIFGHNAFKWERKIEPLRYTEAQRRAVEALELVAASVSNRFFALATAQSNYLTACTNYANADTLYRYAEGRYNLGTISESEMLQLELNRLTEQTNRMTARMEVENSMQSLRSYLGLKDQRELVAVTQDSVPSFYIDADEALRIARSNSPDKQTFARRRLESESEVRRARGETGLKADLYMQFGLTQTADRLGDAYRNPLDQQYVTVGISLPLLDWGRGKGKVRVATSQRDLTRTQMEQAETDFDLNVYKLVSQFNLQQQRVGIAVKADRTAHRRHEVTHKLYLLGKSTLLDLNAAIAEKDSARRNRISTLHQYWSLYYTLRSITLFDFERREQIER